MRKLFHQIIIITVINSLSIFAQDSLSISTVDSLFKNFSYENVIDYSGLLLNRGELTNTEKIELYTMSGISYYTLDKEDSARISFIEILKLDSEFELNPVKVSPKIIAFFSEIKRDYSEIIDWAKSERNSKDTLYIKDNQLKPDKLNGIYINSTARSVIVPGWGHLYIGKTLKGVILTTASTSLLGGMIYYIIKAKDDEIDYLNETDFKLISEKYDAYNESYKIRNYLIAGYVAVWLFTQIDLLLFEEDTLRAQVIPPGISLMPGSNRSDIKFSLTIAF